jgi:hypothetical protein
MQHVLVEDSVSAVDYLSGDDNYKQDWMSSRRERYGIAAYNPRSAVALFKLIAHKLSAAARRLGLRKGPDGA